MNEQIIITRPTDGLAIQANTVTEIVLGVGLQGPAGPAGAAGFDFTQSSVGATWTIAHNLGHRPVVEVRTAGGAVIWGSVLHLSANVAQVSFNSAISGTARCV